MDIVKLLISIILFLIIDIVWIRLFAMIMYQKYIQEIMSTTVKLLPVILFYLFYPLIIYILNKIVNIENLLHTLIFGFLIGILAYGTYNLTNMGLLKTWDWKIVIFDTLWGGVLTTITIYIIHLMNK